MYQTNYYRLETHPNRARRALVVPLIFKALLPPDQVIAIVEAAVVPVTALA